VNDIIIRNTILGKEKRFPEGTELEKIVRSIKNRRYPFEIRIYNRNDWVYTIYYDPEKESGWIIGTKYFEEIDGFEDLIEKILNHVRTINEK